MDPLPNPEPLELAYLLPGDSYHHLIDTVRAALPLPLTDTPEAFARRDNAAIAQIACLLPANASEASLAAQYVLANAQSLECLRLSRNPALALVLVLKCSAAATGMMRQSQGAMRLLLRVQAERRKIEADPVTAERAAWTEHCAAGMMAQALSGAPAAAIAMPPPPPVRPAPQPAQDDEPVIDPIAAAEEYALIYPQRAALIRRLGGLPDNVSFGPPEDYLVRALVTGKTPTLLALDREAETGAA